MDIYILWMFFHSQSKFLHCIGRVSSLQQQARSKHLHFPKNSLDFRRGPVILSIPNSPMIQQEGKEPLSRTSFRFHLAPAALRWDFPAPTLFINLNCYPGATSRKGAEETFHGMVRKRLSMARQSGSLRRSLLGKRRDFPLLSQALLSWTRATTSRRGTSGTAAKSMDLEGCWQRIHNSSFLEVLMENQFNPISSKDKLKTHQFKQKIGVNPRNSEEFCFRVGITGRQDTKPLKAWMGKGKSTFDWICFIYFHPIKSI